MNITTAEPIGGFKSVDFYLLTEVSNMPDVLTDANSGTLVFSPEAVSVCASLIAESITVDDKASAGEPGKTWPVSAAFTFFSRTAAMEQVMEQYASLPGVFLAHHNEGWCKLFGTAEEPMYMEYAHDYGTKVENAGGMAITITGTQSTRPVFYVTP